jgi:hypothetical protein
MSRSDMFKFNDHDYDCFKKRDYDDHYDYNYWYKCCWYYKKKKPYGY